MFAPAISTCAGHILHVGNTQVFGVALHSLGDDHHDCVYLNVAGPATSVESVWAALVERRTVLFQPDGSPRPRYLRHSGLPGDKGSPFVRFQRRIPSLQIDHLILLDKRFVEPLYAETGLTFVFDAPNLAQKLYEHVQRLVNLPVFPEWTARLPDIGRMAGLLLPLSTYGQQQVYALNPNRSRWELQLRLRLERGELGWPGDETPLKPLAALPDEPHQPTTPDTAPLPHTPITPTPATRSLPDTRPALAGLTLPAHLVAQGWRLGQRPQHLHGNSAQARGPEGSTRLYHLPAGATPAQLDDLRDQLAREIQLRAPSGGDRFHAAPPPNPDPIQAFNARLKAHRSDRRAPDATPAGPPPPAIRFSRPIRLDANGNPVPEPDSTPAPSIPFTLTHERDWTWLAFEQKPPEWVLITLKTHGFRWGRSRGAWYCKRPIPSETVESWLKSQ